MNITIFDSKKSIVGGIMPVLKINGFELFYDEKGPKNKKTPIVFVHGWTANRHRWDDQMKFFAKERRVFCFDLRGHGDSEKSDIQYSIKQLADDLNAFLEALKLKKVILAGHSMGGMTVQQFTLDHPEKVERIILVDSISQMIFSKSRAMIACVSKLVPFNMFVKTNIVRAFKKDFPRETLKTFIAMSAATPKHVVMSCFDAMSAFNVIDKLPQIKAKTLIIHGLYDIQLPISQILRTATLIPNAKMKVIDSGHESPIEVPAQITSAIDEFLKED